MGLQIKTTITRQGALDLGDTSLGGLMAIGAMAATASRYDSAQECYYGIQTDSDGMQVLMSGLQAAQTGVSETVEVIGEMLANCNVCELSEESLQSVGWLLRSLGEIGAQLQSTRAVFEKGQPGLEM